MNEEKYSPYKGVLISEAHNNVLFQLKHITGKSRNALIREAIEDLLYKYQIAKGNRKLQEIHAEEQVDEKI